MASRQTVSPPSIIALQPLAPAPAVQPYGGVGKWRRFPPNRYYPSMDYFPGQSLPAVDAGQFLYPSAYGYALPNRNEYNAPVNPYFPGLAYSQFAYPILYYPTGWDGPGNEARPPANSNAAAATGATPDDSTPGGQPPLAAPSSDSTASQASTQAAQSGGRLSPEPNSVIEAVQTELARRGYYTGAPDGVAGPATAEAIRRFQLDLRLRPTGRVNQATLFALDLN